MTSIAVHRDVTGVRARIEPVSRPHSVALWGTTTLVLWGVASFGAVYDWARTPLLLAAAVTAIAMGRRHLRRRDSLHALLIAAVIGSAALQAVPIPHAARRRP